MTGAAEGGAPVLFDLDGTLVDSRAGIVAATNAQLVAMGRAPVPEAELVPRIGPPLHDTFAALVPGLGGRELDAAVAAYRARYREMMLAGTAVYPGIPALLDELRARGRRLAVATSKAGPLARELLGALGLANRFAAIVGPEPPARDEKPETVARTLSALGVAGGAELWMVGDRRHDMAGAAAHGLRGAGVLWGFGDAAELERAGADVLVATPAELLAALTTGAT